MINNKNLNYLAEQGVFLFNTCLISYENKPLFFQKEKILFEFSKSIISTISNLKEHVVFLLLGNKAFENEKYIDGNKHMILKTSHPSPLSAYRGFLGSNIFLKCNSFLKENNIKEIEWFYKDNFKPLIK